MIVGLISDTHGLLRPAALDALRDASLILHAGDVGKPEILDRLRRLAPLIAVRGNVDKGPWADALPLTAAADAGAVRIYMLHNLDDLDLDPAAVGFHIVVSGHSHQPSRTEKSGVAYLNPGSAGPRRFRLPISLAKLDLHTSPWKVEFVELDHSANSG
jgi:putative phosphoesterase